jgi:hypothetical protein
MASYEQAGFQPRFSAFVLWSLLLRFSKTIKLGATNRLGAGVSWYRAAFAELRVLEMISVKCLLILVLVQEAVTFLGLVFRFFKD